MADRSKYGGQIENFQSFVIFHRRDAEDAKEFNFLKRLNCYTKLTVKFKETDSVAQQPETIGA